MEEIFKYDPLPQTDEEGSEEIERERIILNQDLNTKNIKKISKRKKIKKGVK